MDETIFVYAALASWRGVKGAPKAASKGMLKYDQHSLYDVRRAEYVAWPVGKGKRRVIAIREGAGQRYGSWGRSSGNAADYVRQAVDPKVDGPVLMLPYPACSTLNGATPDWPKVVATLARNNVMAEAYALATAIRMPVSKIPRPAYKYEMEPYYRHRSDRTQAALDGLDPVKVKAARELARREKRYQEARRLHDRFLVSLVNRDKDYQIATAHVARGDQVLPEKIAAYLDLPLDTYIKFVMPSGCGTQQASHVYSGAELRGETATPWAEPAICRSGYHFTDIANWYNWNTRGSDVYLVEPNGIAGRVPNKFVSGSIRFARKLGSTAEIEQGAKNTQAQAVWDLRYGSDAWVARDAIMEEYQEFYPGPQRAAFGLV